MSTLLTTTESISSQESILQSLMDVSISGVILFRPIITENLITDLEYIWLNTSAQRMLKLAEKPAETFLELYPNAVQTGIFAFYRDTFISAKPGKFSINYSYDGLDNFFHLSAKKCDDLLVVSFDDTADRDRTKAEEDLRIDRSLLVESQKIGTQQLLQFNQIFEQAPVGFSYMTAKDLTIEIANPYILNLWDKTKEQALNKTLLEALPELKGQGLDVLFQNVIATGEPFIGNEYEVKMSRNGMIEPRYFNFIYQPFRDIHDNIVGVITIALDVSSQVLSKKIVNQLNLELENKVIERTKELDTAVHELQSANEEIWATNEELSDSNKKLTIVNSDLDNFVYTASHDLKSPITNIEGLLINLFDELESHEIINEGTKSLIKMMHTSIQRFKRTILDLTDISKVQNLQNDEEEKVNFEELLEDIKLSILDKINHSKVNIVANFNDLEVINFSRKNLRSILYNLIDNAIKYRDPAKKPEVHISLNETDTEILLTVKDNGLGIRKEDQDKVFSMFKKFHDHEEGTGIGLYIVKKIVQNSGGDIQVESEVGRGSKFTVYFKKNVGS
ncbi:MAG: HAMP domain-containing histidine kinase [Opitutaceae bacterium]|nr:HAMP domain-containing histidine kinase [Cytophagales bacterium]